MPRGHGGRQQSTVSTRVASSRMDRLDHADFPLRRFLGMDMEVVEPGHAVTRLRVGETHLNPNGVVHGGVLFTMIDTGMGLAAVTVLDGDRCASIEVHLRFLSPATLGLVEAHSTVVRRGRRVVHVESRVHDDAGTLVATGTGTFAVVSA